MHSGCVFKHFDRSYFLQNTLPICVWAMGILLGVRLGAHHPFTVDSAFCASLIAQPSVINEILVLSAPVLLVVLCLKSGGYVFSFPILFGYGLSNGFCGALLSYVWGSGAWLIRLLLLFPAGGTSFIIWFLLFRYRLRNGTLFLSDICFVFTFLLSVIWINYAAISPVLAALIE